MTHPEPVLEARDIVKSFGRVQALRGPAPEPPLAALLPAAADRFFRAERLAGPATLAQGFAVLLVLDGAGSLETGEGGLDVGRGDAVLIPWSAGPVVVAGELVAVVCRPPDPEQEAR